MRTQRPTRTAPEWLDELVQHVASRPSPVLSPATSMARAARTSARISSSSFARGYDMRPAARRASKANETTANRVAS